MDDAPPPLPSAGPSSLRPLQAMDGPTILSIYDSSILTYETTLQPVPGWFASLAWLASLSADALSRYLASPTTVALGLFAGTELMAYGWGECVAPDADLHGILVHPLHQRKGLGRTLLQGWLEACHRQGGTQSFLEVGASNKPAQQLYTSLGGVLIGTRKNYYGHRTGTEDALVFALSIPLKNI